jgi:hypothetical protein
MNNTEMTTRQSKIARSLISRDTCSKIAYIEPIR